MHVSSVQRRSTSLLLDPSPPFNVAVFVPPASTICFISIYLCFTSRNSSTLSGKAELIEIDVESSSSSSATSSSSWPSSDIDFEARAIRNLEDIVQRVIVQRSTPDWLPFVPGSSFWVPPRRSGSLKMIDLVGRLAEPLSEEESLSLTTSRGWPCSDFPTRGHDSGTVDSPEEEVEMGVEVDAQPRSR